MTAGEEMASAKRLTEDGEKQGGDGWVDRQRRAGKKLLLVNSGRALRRKEEVLRKETKKI